MPTIQENKTFMYHFATQALYRQGEKSEYRDFCRYRHPDGVLKCAIGHMIPDESYEPAMEQYGLFTDNVTVGLFGTVDVPEELLWFARSIQRIHDYHEPADWPKEFELLAKNHGIETRRAALDELARLGQEFDAS